MVWRGQPGRSIEETVASRSIDAGAWPLSAAESSWSAGAAKRRAEPNWRGPCDVGAEEAQTPTGGQPLGIGPPGPAGRVPPSPGTLSKPFPSGDVACCSQSRSQPPLPNCRSCAKTWAPMASGGFTDGSRADEPVGAVSASAEASLSNAVSSGPTSVEGSDKDPASADVSVDGFADALTSPAEEASPTAVASPDDAVSPELVSPDMVSPNDEVSMDEPSPDVESPDVESPDVAVPADALPTVVSSLDIVAPVGLVEAVESGARPPVGAGWTAGAWVGEGWAGWVPVDWAVAAGTELCGSAG